MSSIQLRAEINKYLDKIDGSFLRVVHSMLSTYMEEQQEEEKIIGYKVSGEPLLADEAKIEFKKRLEEMENGDFITSEDLRKESETW